MAQSLLKCFRFLVVLSVAICIALLTGAPTVSGKFGVPDFYGQVINITLTFDTFSCRGESVVIGKANNFVVDRVVGKDLCAFLMRKENEFGVEFSQWKHVHEAQQYQYRGNNFCNFFRNWRSSSYSSSCTSSSTTFPKFVIHATVSYWHAMDFDSNNNPYPWIISSFEYKLPLNSELCYGRFSNMVEKFQYFNRNLRQYSDRVILSVAPEFYNRNQTWYYSAGTMIRETKNPAPATSLFPEMPKLNSPVVFSIPLDLFWEYEGDCFVYDGRFYTDDPFFTWQNTHRSLCNWANATRYELARTRGGLHYVHESVMVKVQSIDFFNYPRVVFCGTVSLLSPLKEFPYHVCFYVDNKFKNQKIHNRPYFPYNNYGGGYFPYNNYGVGYSPFYTNGADYFPYNNNNGGIYNKQSYV